MARRRRKHAAHVPHLFRQRGKAKIWSALVEGREVSLGTADAGEAHRRLVEIAAERERAASAPAEAPAPLLSELAAKFAEHIQPPRMTEKSAKDYQNRVASFVEWCEGQNVMKAAEVDFKLMSRFVKARSSTVKARTVNRDVRPVRRMYAFAKREGYLPCDPFRHEDFRELRLKEALPRPNALTLSPAQVTRTIACAGDLLHPGHAALIALVAGSGLRIDEARHLDVGDVEIIDDKRGYITVTPKDGWQPKSYRFRTIPVSRATCDAALKFIGERDKVRLDDKATWDAIRIVREKLMLPKFSIHDLRRAWASAMHANGATLKQVSVWLGHSSIGVTERYIRVFETETTGHEFLPR